MTDEDMRSDERSGGEELAIIDVGGSNDDGGHGQRAEMTSRT